TAPSRGARRSARRARKRWGGSAPMTNLPPRFGSSHAGDTDALVPLAPSFVIRLSALIRTARTHDVANQAFQRQLEDFMALLAKAMEIESEVVIAAAADYLYLNGTRIKAESSLLTIYHSLIGEFERRQLG